METEHLPGEPAPAPFAHLLAGGVSEARDQRQGGEAPADFHRPRAALGDGDVSALAENLRDAFGATVVGLLVGTVAFALTLARTRTYTEDLAGLEQGIEPLVKVASAVS